MKNKENVEEIYNHALPSIFQTHYIKIQIISSKIRSDSIYTIFYLIKSIKIPLIYFTIYLLYDRSHASHHFLSIFLKNYYKDGNIAFWVKSSYSRNLVRFTTFLDIPKYCAYHKVDNKHISILM